MLKVAVRRLGRNLGEKDGEAGGRGGEVPFRAPQKRTVKTAAEWPCFYSSQLLPSEHHSSSEQVSLNYLPLSLPQVPSSLQLSVDYQKMSSPAESFNLFEFPHKAYRGLFYEVCDYHTYVCQ
jgi:hypothetical protein